MLVNTHKLRNALFMAMAIMSVPLQAQQWSLQQCIDTAQVKNKMLQMSANNVSIGEQRHKETVAGLIPKVNINGDYKYYFDLPYQLMPMSTFNPAAPAGQFKEAQFGVAHNLNFNVQFSMPLFNSQVIGAMETTKIGGELSKLQLQKTKEQVFFDISNLYYNVQILQKQLAFIDSNLVNTSKLLSNMQLLKEQLMIKATDVTKVQLQLAQLTTQSEIEAEIIKLLPAHRYDIIITHDSSGEYTQHPRHQEINKAVLSLWHNNKISTAELWTFAYEDGNAKYFPKAIRSAPIFQKLPEIIWNFKYKIMTETYGFETHSWEAETTPLDEAFWQFKDAGTAFKTASNSNNELEMARMSIYKLLSKKAYSFSLKKRLVNYSLSIYNAMIKNNAKMAFNKLGIDLKIFKSPSIDIFKASYYKSINNKGLKINQKGEKLFNHIGFWNFKVANKARKSFNKIGSGLKIFSIQTVEVLKSSISLRLR